METKKENKEIQIGGVATKTFFVKLIGTSPLIVHKFSEKAQDKILEKQMKTATKAPGKEAKNPEQDYKESLYLMKDGRYGFPISGFKKAAIAAGSFVDGITKVNIRGAFHIIDEHGENLTPIMGTPHMRKDVVRLKAMGNPADIRYRGEFPIGWKVKLKIVYNENAISIDQIVQLLNTAGFSVGIGDWRPQRDGPYGMFEVDGNADK